MIFFNKICIFFICLSLNFKILAQDSADTPNDTNDLEFSIFISENVNYNPEGKLSIQFKNGEGIIFLYGKLCLNHFLSPFRLGFFNIQTARDIYFELNEYLNDEYRTLGTSCLDSAEGKLFIRKLNTDKTPYKNEIVYFANYENERFENFYNNIISLAIKYSKIPNIKEFYDENGLKQYLENLALNNKNFEHLELISNYIKNYDYINIKSLDKESVVKIFVNPGIPFDIKENVYNIWSFQFNKDTALYELLNYFFAKTKSYSTLAKQEFLIFIEKHETKNSLKKLCGLIIESKEIEMAGSALAFKKYQKHLLKPFKDIFLNSINSSNINIARACVQSLDNFYYNESYVPVFYNLLKDNINKNVESNNQKKLICSLFKAIDKYFNVDSNYLCCFNSVQCSQEEINKIFIAIESRVMSRKNGE